MVFEMANTMVSMKETKRVIHLVKSWGYSLVEDLVLKMAMRLVILLVSYLVALLAPMKVPKTASLMDQTMALDSETSTVC